MPQLFSAEKISEQYKKFKILFDEFDRGFDSLMHILKHSSANIDYEAEVYGLEIEGEDKTTLDEISTEIKKIKKICTNIERCINREDLDQNYISVIKTISFVIARHEKVAAKVKSLEQNLPVVQTIKLYLHRAVALLGKLCEAVVNLFTQTLPNKVSAAKTSLITSFNKLRAAEADQKVGEQPSSISGLEV